MVHVQLAMALELTKTEKSMKWMEVTQTQCLYLQKICKIDARTTSCVRAISCRGPLKILLV